MSTSSTPYSHFSCPLTKLLVKSRSQWWCCKSRCWLSFSHNQIAGMPGAVRSSDIFSAKQWINSHPPKLKNILWMVPKMCKNPLLLKHGCWWFLGRVFNIRGMGFKLSKGVWHLEPMRMSCCKPSRKPNHLTIENKMQHGTSTVTPKWYEIPLIAVKQHQPLFPYGGIWMVSWYTFIPSISNAAGKSNNDPSIACFCGIPWYQWYQVYICIYMYIYISVYIYVCICICICMCMCICICICISICIMYYVYVYVYVYVYRVLYVDKQQFWSQLNNTWFWLHLGVCIRNRTKGTT